MFRSQSYCFRCIITIYFFFFLHLLPNTFASPTRSLCRHDQRDALLELKKEFPSHTKDDALATTLSWNKSVDCCSWWGVTCDDILGQVISLKLQSYTSVNTSLKSSSGLFKLQHLRHLDLSNCNLHGEIPSSIGNLSRLTYLDLSFNQFIGEIPVSIGNLNQLRYLSLWSNDLRGNIPTSMANFTKLSDLNLKGNQFTGGDIILANLTSLSELDLSYNHLKSSLSVDLSGLHNLERFIGDENSFFGPFPSSLLMISSLRMISLDQNQLEGPLVFGNISSSSKLLSLDVSYNKFCGLIPTSISKLQSLYAVDLSHNNFIGQVPSSISSLVNLSSLDLSYNNLEGEIPSLLWRSSMLWSLELSHNMFSSFDKQVEVVDGASLRELRLGSNSLQRPFPQWICKLKDLWALDLSNNQFTGSIPQCLKNSISLSELRLRNNSLSGFIPDSFINLTDLRSLDVSHNNLVGKLPRSLIHCKLMRLLNVDGNKISDTFPFWLGSLEILKILVLRSNAFHGPVYDPTTYLGFPSLRIINIANNNFVGSLPQNYFANWTEMSIVWSNEDSPESNYMGDDSHMYEDSIDLVYKGVETDFTRIFQAFKAIDFSGNRFSGHIPGSIGNLSELRFLNFSGNAFRGNIPASLENIAKLEALDLSCNNLSGEIPQGLGNLSFLSYINVSHNDLEGLVPQSTQFQSQHCSSFVGNSRLYGLEKICNTIHVDVPVPASQPLEESFSDPEEPVLNWIAAAIAYGPGVICGLVLGHIFTSYKHEWFIAR
ncbi:unnamed protein product [Eruca vesicaria subsp. sativa]|uniref:Leucine-rich repeat-containing N-terminal plant-type domain-containing protein n=1 Tax=Eruca vesicaria subsp. sativa TaxID=29727 RepID=A0ABC8LEQ9_ERUVS|nr:unnamed protein product [Eruca vesicaria subsp. sativa]